MNRTRPTPARVLPEDRQALEVTALLGDSVLGVRYVRPSSRGRRSDRFTVGRAPDVDFATDHAPAERFELIAPTAAGPRVRLVPGMRVELAKDGERIDLEEMSGRGIAAPSAGGAREIDIPRGSRLFVEVGPVRFVVGWVPAPRPRSVGRGGTFERRLAGFLAVSVVVHLAFLGLVDAIPPDASRLSLDTGASEGRLARTRFKPREEPKKEESEPGSSLEVALRTGEREPRAGGRKGTVGEPEAPRAESRAAIEERDVEPRLARHQAIERARHAGILGELRSARQVFTSAASRSPFSSGWDEEDVRGGRYGPEVAAVHGPFSSTWGSAPHDLSDHPYYREGLIEAGALQSGGWDKSDFVRGPGGPGADLRRSPKAPEVEIGPAVAACGDSADCPYAEIIRRHVRRKLARVRHCYQKALIGSPDLEGTATVAFTITGEGRVLGARAGGMGSDRLHACVAGVISTIQFPRSPSGTAANVRYPFHLRRAGSR